MRNDDLDDLTNIYINNVIYPDATSVESEEGTPCYDVIEMPRSIFVTQVPNDVFRDQNIKHDFERLFPLAINFAYFPNFKRVRVEFEDSLEACRVRVKFHLFNFRGHCFRVFLTNHIDNTSSTSMDYLKPPKATKQFLISPPPSPPEGWVQFEEDRPNTLQPGLGFELISKLAALNAGESHEIIERTASHPSIVLFTCEDDESPRDRAKIQIPQTRRPDIKRS